MKKEITNYRIDFQNGSITELSNNFSTYYHCTKLTNNDKKNYLCIIYDNSFYIPGDIIEKITESPMPNMPTIEDYGMYSLEDGTKKFVVIIESYDYKSSLESMLNNHRSFSEKEIINNIALPILNSIIYCINKEIPLGGISPNNIFYDGEQIKIRENFSFPINYTQQDAFIAPELINTDARFRTPYSHKSDLYSLGILLHMLYSESTISASIEEKLRHGSFHSLSNICSLPFKLNKIVKLLVEDDIYNRPNASQMLQYILYDTAPTIKRNKLYNYDISFNKNIYSHLKHLANDLYNSWEEALSFVSQDKFFHILQRYKHLGFSKLLNTNNMNREKTLLRFLSRIDPTGPIYIREFIFSPVCLMQICYEFIDDIGIISNIIYSIKDLNLDTKYSNLYDYFNIKRIQTNIDEVTNSDQGSRLEQILYQNNPYIACQGKNLEKYYITDIEELLRLLENSPEQIENNNITSFIKAKLGLVESNIEKYVNNFIPYNRSLDILYLFSTVKEHMQNASTKNICKYIGKKVWEYISEHVSHIKLKEIIKKQIEVLSEKEDLKKIIELLNNNSVFDNDNKGYINAMKETEKLDNKIADLSESTNIFNKYYNLGHIAVFISAYILLVIALMLVTLI